MNVALLLFAFILIVALAVARPAPAAVCPAHYDPVCERATGRAFSNACRARAAGLADGAFAPCSEGS